MGPSGAGKSTLLNLIAGFVRPTAGQVLWQGQDITALPPAQRPIAMLFQDNNLFPHLTIHENLKLAVPKGQDAGRISDVLARVGLAGFETRKPAELSGGQQSRAALARALLQTRPLLLLDEPFAALGPALRHQMLDLVAQITHENDIQTLMVTHNPEDAARIAAQTIIVSDGQMAPTTATHPLFAAMPEALKDYL